MVRQLARSMTVILGARDLEKGRAAAKTLSDEGINVLPRKLDVTNQASIDHLVMKVATTANAIQLGAGLFSASLIKLADTRVERRSCSLLAQTGGGEDSGSIMMKQLLSQLIPLSFKKTMAAVL